MSTAQLRCLAYLLTVQLACVTDAEPRPQLVFVIDTDAHLVDALAAHPEVSPDSAMDSVRVDVLNADSSVASHQVFSVSDYSNWPVSFGVSGTAERQVQLRIRLFRARDALVREGVLTPFTETAVDRLVVATIPTAGVQRLRVELSFACLGRASQLDSDGSPTTCLDAKQLDVDPRAGLEQLRSGDVEALERSAAGSWSDAIETPCASPEAPDVVCIPGGFTILGDRYAAGLVGDPRDEPVPLRPVRLSAFRMDRFEYTVGRFRRLLGTTGFTGKLPRSGVGALSPINQACTWLDAQDDAHDALPLNCIAHSSAAQICELEGGMLPTEAQWEHAARGRGEGRQFPWGDTQPRCCMLSGQRALAKSEQCGRGVEAVGSHVGAECDGQGDVSRDGVVDLAGSLREALRDAYASYRDDCWSQPLALDPYCAQGSGMNHSSRGGGSWAQPLFYALPVLRDYYSETSEYGFRCVYPEANP